MSFLNRTSQVMRRMPRYQWLGLFGLLFSSCGGEPGVLVDIGSWPVEAVTLRVMATLDGQPSTAPLQFPRGTTRFIAYAADGTSGQLGLEIVALDENSCARASAQTEVTLGSGLRRVAEVALPLRTSAPPYCPPPELLRITPAAESTLGGVPLVLSGQHFLPGITVTVAGYPAGALTAMSSTQLIATLPRHLGAFGLVPVVVQNPDGQRASRSDLFAYSASQLDFSTMTPITCDQYPRTAAVADLNRDDYVDVVVSNGAGSVSVLLNDKKGSFHPANNIPLGDNAARVVVADFNRDAFVDMAVTAYGANSVNILLGDGHGGFSASTHLPDIGSPGWLGVGDFNADQNPDLVVVNDQSSMVSVLLGNGKAGFSAATTFPVGSAPRGVAVGDFNGDKAADLAVASFFDNGVYVLLGDGKGGFGRATRFLTGPGSIAVATGELNGDGQLDLAVANYSDDSVSVLLGDGKGRFGAPTHFGAGSGPYALALADFDGDQQFDLAFANNTSNSVRVLLGDGKGSFRTAGNFATGNSPYFLVVGDFNRDQKPDLATANYSSANLSVFLNRSQ